MRRLLALFAAVSVVTLAGVVGAVAQSRVALVIGQSAYRAVTPLPNPANDAKAIAQLLGDAGFDVTSASDLNQTDLRDTVSEFAEKIASKGPDTVALVYYAGHGLQIDGENYLVPVDVDPKREADIPLQAMRLNDVMNTLSAVPSRMRIVLLDACRNNPFPGLNKTAGRGLAIVDAKVGAPGTFVSYSTSPGAEAEDGTGGNSPYTAALLAIARQPGVSIEDAFKRVRLAVHKATDSRQTPWDSSSLTDDFRFFAAPGTADVAKPVTSKRSVDEWRAALRGKTPEEANEVIVSDGTEEAYEAFIADYGRSPLGPVAREWLDRQRRMVAWKNAGLANTAASYRAFLAQYPDSDLSPTARKLEERLRNRPLPAGAAASGGIPPTNVALAPTCPCGPNAPAVMPPARKKAAPAPAPARRAEPQPPKRASNRPLREPRPLPYDDDDDVVIYRRGPSYAPPPDVYIGRGGYGGSYGGSRGGPYR
ncbi:MAG: caspase [Tardiphaga sp.]|nr:caspase [Tardiphaga sp.]